MYNEFVHKLANAADNGDVLIMAGNITVPVKVRQVDVSHSTDCDRVEIRCDAMFKKHGKSYDVASLYPRQLFDYANAVIEKELYNSVFGAQALAKKANPYEIDNVIFNDPATIVFWKDGTKTVVKCQEGDVFDPEKGLAMAMCKKMLGNKGNFNEVFKKWMPEVGEEEERTTEWERIAESIRPAVSEMFK